MGSVSSDRVLLCVRIISESHSQLRDKTKRCLVKSATSALANSSSLLFFQLFGRKYARAADLYSNAVFLELFGDESKDTRVSWFTQTCLNLNRGWASVGVASFRDVSWCKLSQFRLLCERCRH